MSAPNFNCNANSKYIYAFCEHGDFAEYVKENRECWGIETDEELENAIYYDETLYHDWYSEEKRYYLEWLGEELEKQAAACPGLYIDFSEEDAAQMSDGDEVATVRRYFDFAGGRFVVKCSIDFEAGYYEGFSLDWKIKEIEGVGSYWHSSFDFMPDTDDCAEMLEDETDLNKGLCKALASKMEARIAKELKTITEAIEKALQTVSPYHLSGVVLGNGEGIYTNHVA